MHDYTGERPKLIVDKTKAGPFKVVIKEAEQVIDDLMSGKWHPDNDNAEYIYESVMQALYGPGIFKLFNGLDD